CAPDMTCDASSGKAVCVPVVKVCKYACMFGQHCDSTTGTCVPDAGPCALARCTAGTHCDDTSGKAVCVKDPVTCATTKCAGGDSCVDRPIVCITAPCDATAPSCEACPAPGTYIDCMPGPGVPKPLCTDQARASITANCPGVDFVF